MFAYDYERMLELLKIERKCVKRASGLDEEFEGACNRDCANCELVQKDKDLLEMYDKVIRLVEREAKKVKREKGYKEKQKRFDEAMGEMRKNDTVAYDYYMELLNAGGEGW